MVVVLEVLVEGLVELEEGVAVVLAAAAVMHSALPCGTCRDVAVA